MESRGLGKTDIHLSPIIMGTWQTGKSMWTGIDDAQSEKAIRAAMDAGITTFDTAEVYGSGHSRKFWARPSAATGTRLRFCPRCSPTILNTTRWSLPATVP
jgi:myo-inositol catabolism protein IolS